MSVKPPETSSTAPAAPAEIKGADKWLKGAAIVGLVLMTLLSLASFFSLLSVTLTPDNAFLKFWNGATIKVVEGMGADAVPLTAYALCLGLAGAISSAIYLVWSRKQVQAAPQI